MFVHVPHVAIDVYFRHDESTTLRQHRSHLIVPPP